MSSLPTTKKSTSCILKQKALAHVVLVLVSTLSFLEIHHSTWIINYKNKHSFYFTDPHKHEFLFLPNEPTGHIFFRTLACTGCFQHHSHSPAYAQWLCQKKHTSLFALVPVSLGTCLPSELHLNLVKISYQMKGKPLSNTHKPYLEMSACIVDLVDLYVYMWYAMVMHSNMQAQVSGQLLTILWYLRKQWSWSMGGQQIAPYVINSRSRHVLVWQTGPPCPWSSPCLWLLICNLTC